MSQELSKTPSRNSRIQIEVKELATQSSAKKTVVRLDVDGDGADLSNE